MPRFLNIRVTRSIVNDMAWVGFAQGMSAIGALVGVRLLTGMVDPHTYGEVMLSLGLVMLGLSIGCNPLAQAAQHFFPQAIRDGQRNGLHAALRGNLRRVAPWVLAGFVAVTGVFTWQTGQEPYLPLLLLALLACDVVRNLRMALLNAGRRHRRYALWMATEAWLRPLAAAAAMTVWPDSPAVFIAAYLVVGLGLLAAFRTRDEAAQVSPGTAAASPQAPDLQPSMLRYAMPLFALGLIDWSNGMADRYLIGSLISVADAGLYVAVYSIASRPFLLVGQALELAVRPPYQAAVSRNDHPRARQLLRVWALLVGTGGLAGVALVALLSPLLAQLLLGEGFRHGAYLMPFIASGYALLALAQVFQRVCFAHGQTHWVLRIQASAAVVGVAATTLGAWHAGLRGAAAAVPVCFFVQLCVSIYAAWRVEQVRRRHAAVPPAAPVA